MKGFALLSGKSNKFIQELILRYHVTVFRDVSSARHTEREFRDGSIQSFLDLLHLQFTGEHLQFLHLHAFFLGVVLVALFTADFFAETFFIPFLVLDALFAIIVKKIVRDEKLQDASVVSDDCATHVK